MLATPETRTRTGTLLPEHVRILVENWIRNVPLYSEHAGTFETFGGTYSPHALERLPFITKHDIRRNFPQNFLGADVQVEDLVEQELVELEHTSGTSEARTPLLLGIGWWAEQEKRALRLNAHVASVLDAEPEPRRLTLNSPMCSNDICYTGVPSRADRTVGNTLFASLSRMPFLWSDADLARIATEAQQWAPVFLDVDPVYGAVFARYCERKGIRLPSLKFIIASYEFVSVTHRALLERVFQVPVYNLFGSTETGHLLMENEHGHMVPQVDTAFLQTINEDERNVGELVVTTLTNHYMPLLRYRIGDLVQRDAAPQNPCYTVHGRLADAFLLEDGERRTVWDVDQCFADIPGIIHYQITQTGASAFRVKYVSDAAGPMPEALTELRARLGSAFGANASITVESADILMPENSGKFRLCYPLPPTATAS